MRREKKRETGRRRVRTQREVLRDVMLSANECGAWLTLAELAAMTRYPAASISAQLRHLKKPEFGNYEMEKQVRAGADLEDGHGAVWEYRLTRRRRVVRNRARGVAAPVRTLEHNESNLAPAAEDLPQPMTVC